MDEQKHTAEEVNDGMVQALLHERKGYLQRAEAAGQDEKVVEAMTSRVAQVDEQIKLRRGKPPQQAKSPAGRQQQTRTTE